MEFTHPLPMEGPAFIILSLGGLDCVDLRFIRNYSVSTESGKQFVTRCSECSSGRLGSPSLTSPHLA